MTITDDTADQFYEDELETLALEGLNSGEPIEPAPGYWDERLRRLAERMNRSSAH